MREWQSLLQVLHVYAGCWTELTQSFLRTRLSVAACVNLSSPVLRCLVTAPLHCEQIKHLQTSQTALNHEINEYLNKRDRNSCHAALRWFDDVK